MSGSRSRPKKTQQIHQVRYAAGLAPPVVRATFHSPVRLYVVDDRVANMTDGENDGLGGVSGDVSQVVCEAEDGPVVADG